MLVFVACGENVSGDITTRSADTPSQPASPDTAPTTSPPRPTSDAQGVQAYRIADFMERFGINTFSTIAASANTPAYNPWGSKGDYSADGVIACINYLEADSGLTMLVREYHYGDAKNARTLNQMSWCPQIYEATGSQFMVCPGSGGGGASDIAGMQALAQSSVSTNVPWLRWLEGDNEANGNGVTPSSAIADQASINDIAHGLGLQTLQMAPIGGLPYAEGYFDTYANNAADTNNVHIYPGIPPDLDDGSNRGGMIGDMIIGDSKVFGDKKTLISEWHPTLYAKTHKLDAAYDAYLAPIFMLSAFVNFDAEGYIWFALHDYSDTMRSGLFAHDVSTAKPAAEVIRTMYALTGDSGDSKRSFAPGMLDVRVSGLPAPINAKSPGTGGHFALFQNSTGTFFLYLWNEQATPGGALSSVTVTFAGLLPTSVADYDITSIPGDMTPEQSLTDVSTMTVGLSAAVHIVVINP
jgi:hypothetical protein